MAKKKISKEPKYIREIQLRFKKKRVGNDAPVDMPLTDSSQVAELFRDMQNETKEKMVAVSLDIKLKILAFEVVAIGSVNSVGMNISECLSTAVVMRAGGLIMVHNHPSGNPTPSREDKAFTKKLVKACDLMGIPLWDHVIVGDGEHFSFADEGLL